MIFCENYINQSGMGNFVFTETGIGSDLFDAFEKRYSFYDVIIFDFYGTDASFIVYIFSTNYTH